MKRKAKKTTLCTKHVYTHTHTHTKDSSSRNATCMLCVRVSGHICAFTIVFAASLCSSFGIREKKNRDPKCVLFPFRSRFFFCLSSLLCHPSSYTVKRCRMGSKKKQRNEKKQSAHMKYRVLD